MFNNITNGICWIDGRICTYDVVCVDCPRYNGIDDDYGDGDDGDYK